MKNKATQSAELPRIVIRGKLRMLCPECSALRVADFQNERNEVFLACKHKRTPALLPPHKGAISIEHILANTPESRALFPVSKAGDYLATLSEDATRERWSAQNL